MGLFSGKYGNCPKCRGRFELATDIAMQQMQRAANANDFSALGSMMMVGGDTYFRCPKCGYIEVRSTTAYGVSKRPYKG